MELDSCDDWPVEVRAIEKWFDLFAIPCSFISIFCHHGVAVEKTKKRGSDCCSQPDVASPVALLIRFDICLNLEMRSPCLDVASCFMDSLSWPHGKLRYLGETWKRLAGPPESSSPGSSTVAFKGLHRTAGDSDGGPDAPSRYHRAIYLREDELEILKETFGHYRRRTREPISSEFDPPLWQALAEHGIQEYFERAILYPHFRSPGLDCLHSGAQVGAENARRNQLVNEVRRKLFNCRAGGAGDSGSTSSPSGGLAGRGLGSQRQSSPDGNRGSVEGASGFVGAFSALPGDFGSSYSVDLAGSAGTTGGTNSALMPSNPFGGVPTGFCAYCGDRTRNRCTRCGCVPYCSETCVRRDQHNHRPMCQIMTELKANGVYKSHAHD